MDSNINQGQDVSLDITQGQDTSLDNSNNNEGDAQEVVEVNGFELINTGLGTSIDFSDLPDESIESFVKYTQRYGKTSVENYLNDRNARFPMIAKLEELAEQGVDTVSLIKQMAKNYEGIVEFDGTNPDVARSLVYGQMSKTGFFSQEEIEAKIAKLEDEGKLLPMANEISKRDIEGAKANEARLIAEREREVKEYQARVNNQLESINKYILGGKIGEAITIPEAEKPKFTEFLDNSYLDADEEGKVFVRKYITNPEDLQSLFYDYRKGKIDDIVKYKAATLQAKKFHQSKPQEVEKNKQEDFKFGIFDNNKQTRVF